jgi:hypothetical protein
MNNFKRYISTASSFLFAFLLIPCISYSQVQQGIPKPTGPIDFSKTSNVIIFVVIPAVILIVFLIYRKRIIKVKQDRKERMKNKKE